MRIIITMPCMGKTTAFKLLKEVEGIRACDFDPKGFKPSSEAAGKACLELFKVMESEGYTDVFCFNGNLPSKDFEHYDFEFIFVIPEMDMATEIIARSTKRDLRGGKISPFTHEYFNNFAKWRSDLSEKAVHYSKALGASRVKILNVNDDDFYIADLYEEVLEDEE